MKEVSNIDAWAREHFDLIKEPNWWAAIEFTAHHPDKPSCELGGRMYSLEERQALLRE